MAIKDPRRLANQIELDNGKNNAITPNPKKGVHVRDWVKEHYPTEFQTDRIKYPFTFEELNDAWKEDQEGGDFYTVASQDGSGFDSEVREEIFNGLVENLGGEYDDYYNRWLGRDVPKKEPYISKLKVKDPQKYESIKKQGSYDDETIDLIAKLFGVELD